MDGARDEEPITSNLKLGEKVWVKPPYARCTPKWSRGAITSIYGPNNSVNGMPRHRLDTRKVIEPVTTRIVNVETTEEGCGDQDVERRSSREEKSVAEVEYLSYRRNPPQTKKLPTWLRD